jgi:hypothetical protein
VAGKEDGGGVGGKIIRVGQLCFSLALLLKVATFDCFSVS